MQQLPARAKGGPPSCTPGRTPDEGGGPSKPACSSPAVSPAVAESTVRPLRASQTAGHHTNKCSADISPMPHSG
eukprot:15484213-Alexandrium_andersonii.AAC.1